MKRFRNIGSLVAIILIAIGLCNLGLLNPNAAFALVMVWQLFQFAMSKPRRGVCFNSVLTPEQVKEFGTILDSFKSYDTLFKELADVQKAEGGFAAIKALPALLKSEKVRADDLHEQVKKLSKQLLESRSRTGVGWREEDVNGKKTLVPYVTEECARFVGSMAVIRAAQSNLLKGADAEAILSRAAAFVGQTIGVEAKAAIATTDIPMPVQYAQQIVELVYTYGSARKVATVYPLGTASVKLPRLKTGEPAFGFINISGAVPEKVPQIEFITFTPAKAGGIVRVPSEIDADSIVAVGQFIARYIAREMAKWEDTCLFLGDGTGTYNSIQGVGAQATTDSTKLQLAATNSSSDKITLANMRTIRALVTGAVLKTAKYYAHPTMDTLFVSFNTSATVVPYQRKADGSATLDGYPIEWVSIMPVYSTSATLNAYQVYFGDLSWWYFGERMSMSVETSRDVYFATDEVGIRALERFDIHLMGQSCSSALQLSAS